MNIEKVELSRYALERGGGRGYEFYLTGYVTAKSSNVESKIYIDRVTATKIEKILEEYAKKKVEDSLS